MASNTTSFDGNPDVYAKVTKAVYELALQEQDGDALAIEKLSPTMQQKPDSKISSEELNKYLIFALKKVTGLLAASLVGDITSTHTDAVIDFLVKAAGTQLPKDGETEIKDLLEDIQSQLGRIREGQEEEKQHTTRSFKIQKISEVWRSILRETSASNVNPPQAQNTVRSIWKDLRSAIKNGDPGRVFKEVDGIDKKEVGHKLDAMRSALRETDADGNDSLACSLQKMYKTRLTDTSGHFTFDAQRYLWHVRHWKNTVSWIDRMATVLLALNQQCRQVEPDVRQRWQQQYQAESESFLTKMEAAFLGDAGSWPSTKALFDASLVDNGAQFPHVFELRNGEGRSMCIETQYMVPFGAREGVHLYPFKDDDKNSSTPVSRAFALEYQSGVWHIKANILPIKVPQDCLSFARWQKLRDGDEKLPLVQGSGNESTFKIIPLEHGSECRVKLLWLNGDRKGVRMTFHSMLLSRVNLPYPVFGDRPEADPTRSRQFIESQPNTKFHCIVTNSTSDLVLVLDDVYSNRTYYYTNTVWLPGESYCMGAWGIRLVWVCFRFAVYKVKGAFGDNNALRTRVRELFGPLPHSGRLGLRADGAELIKYIWLRPHVPSDPFTANSISVTELGLEDRDKDIIDPNTPTDLLNRLDSDGCRAYSNEKKWFGWDRLKAEVRIERGTSPGSFCNIFTK